MMTTLDATKYKNNSSPGTGWHKTTEEEKYALIPCRARSHSTFHPLWLTLNARKSGRNWFDDLEMN